MRWVQAQAEVGLFTVLERFAQEQARSPVPSDRKGIRSCHQRCCGSFEDPGFRMNALIFDPSSTATGWALMPLSGRNVPTLSGILKRPEGWGLQARLGGLRYDSMALFAQLEGQFDRIVIETPGTGKGSWEKERSTKIPSYAMAVGVVVGSAWSVGVPVVCVSADHWTKMGTGRCVPKDRRLAGLEYSGAYDGKDDPGGDRGDAIGLGGWFTMRYGSIDAAACPLFMPEKLDAPLWRDLKHEHGPVPKNARWKPAQI